MARIIQERINRETLIKIARHEIESYAGHSDTSTLYPIFDEKRRCYTVVTIPKYPRKFTSRIVIMARIVNECVVIDEDTTDKPLVDALMVNGGIPREQIVLAYAGETLPDVKAQSDE